MRRRTPSGGWLRDKQLLLIPSRTAIALQDDGWIVRNDIIWAKPTVAPRPETDRLRLSHEHFFHLVQRPSSGRATYFYDVDAAEPNRLDVVTVAVRRGQDGHSATFPPELIRPRIESSCPPGGLVLDPFCGTGRALVIAVQTGRVAHGFELSQRYAQSARANVRRAHLAVDQIVRRRDAGKSP
jgi:DNA modification methylase